MITWQVVRGPSVNSVDINEGLLGVIEGLLIEAGEFWGRYFAPPNDITLTINLGFFELDDTVLATGGGNFSSIGTTASGQNLLQIDAVREIATGVDVDPNAPDLFVNINFNNISDLYFDNDVTTADDIPAFLNDAFTLFVHEIGHGLGFSSILGDAANISDAGSVDTFAQFVQVDGDDILFTGPNAVAVFGRNVPLISADDFIHLGVTTDPLQPILISGVRSFITPLDVAIIQDLGAPLRVSSNAADELFGFERENDAIEGMAGDDSLNGLGGNDTLRGGEGNDVINGGNGIDFISAGDGDDIAIGGVGNDQIFAGSGDTGDDIFIGGIGNDILGGGGGNDLVVGGGSDVIDSIDAGAVTVSGADTLFGGAGNDTLLGGGFADTNNNGRYDQGEEITGSNGANAIFAGVDNDLVIGANSNDTLGGGTGDDTLNGGAGNDTFFGGRGDGDDTGVNDIILAGDGNDIVFSGAGNDSIDGGTGNDELFNGAGADTVLGGAGDDTLFGGAGDDILNGGDGADTFAFFIGNGNDVIVGFNVVEDTLNLSGTSRLFGNVDGVEAESMNVTQNGLTGLLITTGTGDSIFLEGLSVSDLPSVDIVF